MITYKLEFYSEKAAEHFFRHLYFDKNFDMLVATRYDVRFPYFEEKDNKGVAIIVQAPEEEYNECSRTD